MLGRAIWTLLPLLFALTSPACGKDYFLIIGGGYDPSGNQVSLEKNVQFFTEVLERDHPSSYRRTILFADGDDSRPDVQYLAPVETGPSVLTLLAVLFNEDEHFRERYRNHQLADVDAAATPRTIRLWFEKIGPRLGPDDRLLIYVTAHGGKSHEKRRPYNSRLYLWDREAITVSQFAEELEAISPETPIVLVMVQCYSGGFARLLFKDGNPHRGLDNHHLCGFFATTHDRVAAGCTAQINEADYHEYSTSFWAALSGTTRTGETIEQPDYDGDGRTSFNEAHAYVVIHSDTIDMPLKTSDAFLRAYSEFEPSVELAEADPTKGERTTLRPVPPLALDAPVKTLLGAAAPAEDAVITALSKQLELDGEALSVSAGDLSQAIGRQSDSLRKQLHRQSGKADRLREHIAEDVLRQWPELRNAWNPEGRRIVREESQAVVQFIESHQRYHRWREARAAARETADRISHLETKDGKCQRLIHTIESVVLANNLPLVADSSLVERYLALRAAEHATFGSDKGKPENVETEDKQGAS